MRQAKATAGETCVSNWLNLSVGVVRANHESWWAEAKKIDRLVLCGKQTERTRISRIVERCIVKKLNDVHEDNKPGAFVRAVQKQLDDLDWQIKQAIKPATKRKTRSRK